MDNIIGRLGPGVDPKAPSNLIYVNASILVGGTDFVPKVRPDAPGLSVCVTPEIVQVGEVCVDLLTMTIDDILDLVYEAYAAGSKEAKR